MVSPRRRPSLFPRIFTILLLTSVCGSAQLPEWTPVVPTSVTGEQGTRFEIRSDGAVIARGKNPATEVITCELVTPLEGTLALRLEALPDRSFPERGPGRSKNGNFVLGDLRLETATRFRTDKFSPLLVERAEANHEQDKWPVAHALDDKPNSGWAILPHAGNAHQVVLRLDTSLGRDAVIRLRMSFPFGSQHVLGHFRVSVSTASDPFLGMPRGGEPWSAVQLKVNRAIDRGVEWLLDDQHLDGSYREYASDGQTTGSTALVLYTLLKSGISKDHAAVQKAATILRRHEPTRTYSAACHVLALCTLDDPKDKKLIASTVRDLIRWQKEDGGWGYPDNQVDLSNSQYAALALHVAAKAGFRVPNPTWHRLADRVMLHIKPAGESGYAPYAFAYRENGGATGSMSAAGVGLLAILDAHLPLPRADVSNALKKGVDWLGKYFTVTSNRGGNDGWLLYYLYGLERAGGLTDQRFFGSHDWYQDGARVLVARQSGDGHWGTSRGDPTSGTCFALLFLNRATGSVTGGSAGGGRVFSQADPKHPVSIKASGDGALSIWIDRFGDEIVKETAWPGDEGKGLHVAQVEYAISRQKNLSNAQVIATLTGNPTQPHGTQSFATQFEFPFPGVWWIRTKVTLALPALNPEEAGKTRVVSNPPLRITTWDCRQAEALAYASDAERNRIAPPPKVRVEASSEHGPNWSAERALDGLHSLGWLTKDDDKSPWIRITFPRPLRADTLALAHTITSTQRGTRIKEVEVLINGSNVLGTLTMVRDDRRKTIWRFPDVKNVKTLELRIKNRHVSGQQGVGFSEIDLWLIDP